jgi:hypothetical protein
LLGQKESTVTKKLRRVRRAFCSRCWGGEWEKGRKGLENKSWGGGQNYKAMGSG